MPEPNPLPWQILEIAGDRNALFILWLIHDGLCRSEEDFTVHLGKTDIIPILLKFLTEKNCIERKENEYSLTALGLRLLGLLIPSAKDILSWAILLHMQGRNPEAAKLIRNLETRSDLEGPIRHVERQLSKCIQKHTADRGATPQQLEDRSDALIDLIKSLDRLLNPGSLGGSKLAYEPSVQSTDRSVVEGPDYGYSRDPFVAITDDHHRTDIALAAAAYLLRGYATFFCRPRSRRDFNAAKVSLNDFFQCGQLAWRLYRSLEERHSVEGDQNTYLRKVSCGANTNGFPGESPYFVWSVLHMLAIQRGNVYRQIENLHESKRFYQQFWKRLTQLEGAVEDSLLRPAKQPLSVNWSQFVTPTVIRALGEVAKVQFDTGHILESMTNQLLALAYLVKSGPLPNSNGGDTLFEDIRSVRRFLRAENRQSVFESGIILACFGWGDKPDFLRGGDVLTPERFAGYIEDESLELAVDIIAGIGFSLLTLQGGYDSYVRPMKKSAFDTHQAQYNSFFLAHRTLRRKDGSEPSPSPIGLLCARSEIAKEKTPVAFKDSAEYLFSMHLGAFGSGPHYDEQPADDDDSFFGKIVKAATENIHNVATNLRKNQRLLMRHGYCWRRKDGDLSQTTVGAGVEAAMGKGEPKDKRSTQVQNKFVVLRRWQSINPRIPKPEVPRLRGGGCFLLWQGKGIVIDPGYDFIQNFYDEGFSLSDIDAVIVTHSHPDHDDNLSTLTTLNKEWNEYYENTGQASGGNGKKQFDFLLNESTNLKFSAWLKSAHVDLGRVIPLPSVWWDKASKSPSDGNIRGEPAMIRLNGKNGYCFDLEVIPAWHDDVIGKTEAVGLKFHLYDSGGTPVGYLGYTGDTGAYGHDMSERGRGNVKRIETFYEDCDVLVAHLGDIKLRELMTKLKLGGDEHPVLKVFEDWFGDDPDDDSITPARIRNFFRFLITLDLVPSKALLTKCRFNGEPSRDVCVWLDKLTAHNKFDQSAAGAPKVSDLTEGILRAMKTAYDALDFKRSEKTFIDLENRIKKIITWATRHRGEHNQVSDRNVALALTGYLCAFSMLPWQYEYHLGIFGIHLLYKAMVERWKQRRVGRVYIVGELPEELSLYRHHIARDLNALYATKNVEDNEPPRPVYAFTGDIGLHLKLKISGSMLHPEIRCSFCNYNNEAVLETNNYQSASVQP